MYGTPYLIAIGIGSLVSWLLYRRYSQHDLFDPGFKGVAHLDVPPAHRGAILETDGDFDPASACDFILRLPELAAHGITPSQATRITERAWAMDVDDQFDLSYHLIQEGAPAEFHISVFRDDLESIILYFKGSPPVITTIQSAIDQVLNGDD
jgi:hypothetical protein